MTLWKLRRVGFASILFLGGFCIIGAASADEGIMLEPAVQKIFLDENGVTKRQIENVRIENKTAKEMRFRVRGISFENIDATGGNIFLGQSFLQERLREALWIDVKTPEIFLIPGEKKEIELHLKNTATLSSGAHYGAVVLETVDPDKKSYGESEVFLKQVAASLLYVNKGSSDDIRLEGKIERIQERFLSLPQSVFVTMKNEGGSFGEPRGYAVIVNPFGKEIVRTTFNPTSKIVFPEGQREIEAIFPSSWSLIPGSYTLKVFYRAGEGEYQVLEKSFWYWESIATLALLLFTISIGGVFLSQRRKSARIKPH